MAIAEITTATATVNLTTAVTILNYTNSGVDTFGQLTFSVGGASTNKLHTDAGTLTFRISVGGVQGQAIEATVEAAQLRFRQDADPLFIGTGEVILVTLISDNANDTAVAVTATLHAAEPLQSLTRGRSLLVDTDGKADIPAATIASIQSPLATAAALTTVDANVDAILLDTGTTIPATIATVDANVDAILLDTGTTIPATIATVDANVDAILVDTGTTIPATLTADKAEVIAAVDAMSGVVVSGAEINIADTSKRQIEWDSASETITGTVQWDGQVAKAITGAITFRETLGGNHYYDWAYDAADRPTVASAGVVVLTDGVDTSTLAVSFIDVASETTAIEVKKVPRATAELAAGADFTRNKVTDTINALTENFT